MPAAAVMSSPLASLAPDFGDDYEKAALAQTLAPAPASAPVTDSDSARFITFSPYDDHLLDLETYDPQTQLIARALAVFDKTRSDYATAPYPESFNFARVIEELKRLAALPANSALEWKKSAYFVVAFRSQIPPTTDYGDLSSLDKAAHREATDSGGLLRYWFDLPDADGRNLATCLWRSPGDAHKAGHGPQHRKASSSVRSLYKEWRIERYRLVIGDGIQTWEIIPWVDE